MKLIASVPHETIPGLVTEVRHSEENLAMNPGGEFLIHDGYMEVLLIFQGEPEFGFFIVSVAADASVDFISETHTVIAIPETEIIREIGVHGCANSPQLLVTTEENGNRYGRVYTLQPFSVQ